MSLITRFSPRSAQAHPTDQSDVTPDGDDEAAASDETAGGGGRPRWRRVAAGVLTGLAALLVLVAMVAPNQPGSRTLGGFLRIPVEALLGVALALLLPARPRRVFAVLAGVALGLVALVKVIDQGFFTVLGRPFDLVLDWVLFDDGMDFLIGSTGRAGAIGIAIGIVALVVAVLVVMTLSVRRLAGVVVEHRTTAGRAALVLGAAWLACAVLGAQIVPGVPVAARSAGGLVYHRTVAARATLHDQAKFAAEAKVDAFRDTPGDQLLTALRGKDVMLAFVESYGRDAVDDPEFAPQVGAMLDDGTRRLSAAGYASRSAFLTSPTAGGGSWLAHATLLSGLWINNQQRYKSLLTTDRLTLTSAFRRADWRTVGVMPGMTRAWPEGSFYGYDRVYGARELGYRGPNFSWATMPDQYTLAAFERAEHSVPDRPPLMAEIPLISSHGPWAPIPRMIDWGDVGDGSVYHAMVAESDPPKVVWRDTSRVRAQYRRSIEYSVTSLISYVENYGDDNLVLIFLGDHQPSPVITGDGASKDVPITIVARDPAVLDRISEWGWDDGLKPGPRAPVWKMDAFRDRFLTAYGARAG